LPPKFAPAAARTLQG